MRRRHHPRPRRTLRRSSSSTVGRDRTFGVGEGAPPGLDRAVDDVFGPGTFVPADHLRSLGNRAAWGTDDLLRTDFMFNPFGTGWHLDRLAFDARLLAAAEAAGATVRTSPSTGGDVDLAPVVIDASGRRADHARRRGARRIATDRLVAVVTTYAAIGHRRRRHDDGGSRRGRVVVHVPDPAPPPGGRLPHRR